MLNSEDIAIVNERKSVKINCLSTWEKCGVEPVTVLNADLNRIKQPRFPIRRDLNEKLLLCDYNIEELECDCAVLPINEISLRISKNSQLVHDVAGPLLHEHYKKIRSLKTGSVDFNNGYDLPCRHIIHVMEPCTGIKHQSAVGTAINRCYRNAFHIAVEHKIHIIAFYPLYEIQDLAVVNDVLSTVLCTIRCCMQKLDKYFNSVILVLRPEEKEAYIKLLSAYFPRTNSEANESVHLLPSYEIGEWGENIHPERTIRISDFSIAKASKADTDPNDASDGTSDTSSNPDVADLPDSLGKHSFAEMSGDHDKKRRNQLEKVTGEKILKSQERVYRRLLRCARTEDLSAISATRALYLCGVDGQGNPLVVLISKFIDVQRLDLNKALLYFIHILDSVVNEKYTLVYFHTLSQSSNHPSSDFIKKSYNTVDGRYRNNLAQLFIVHPTFWSRVFTWFFAKFSANGLKNKITSIKSLPELYRCISPHQIDIPPFIVEHDRTINAPLYRKLSLQQQQQPSSSNY